MCTYVCMYTCTTHCNSHICKGTASDSGSHSQWETHSMARFILCEVFRLDPNTGCLHYPHNQCQAEFHFVTQLSEALVTTLPCNLREDG